MRLDYRSAFPAGFEAMLGLEQAVRSAGLEPKLLELIKIRASQINGCAFCLDMHLREAREGGETEHRLDLVAAWREAPCYSEAERAALGWCEAVTLLPRSGAPDPAYKALEPHFQPEQIAALTFAIVAINSWNRLAVGFRTPVGG